MVPCLLSFLFHNLVGAAMKSVFQKSLLEVLNPIHSLLCHSNVPNELGRLVGGGADDQLD